MTAEEWRQIPGAKDGYEVSNLGQVRSWRTKSRREDARRVTPLILKQTLGSGGYLQVGRLGNGRGWNAVHPLVLLAFVGSRPAGRLIRHLDSDPHNNALSNLAYGTPSENMRDSVEVGTHANTRKTHCPQGHEYSPENTGHYDGRRYCRPCRRAWIAAYRARAIGRVAA